MRKDYVKENLHQSVKIDVVIWLHDGIGRHEGLNIVI